MVKGIQILSFATLKLAVIFIAKKLKISYLGHSLIRTESTKSFYEIEYGKYLYTSFVIVPVLR